VEVLTACVNPVPEVRRQAEAMLEAEQEREGFCVSLFRILTSGQISHAPRLLSSILLKNLVTRHWSPVQFVGKKKRKDAPRAMTDAEKAFLRENILQACLACPDHIQRQLYPVLRKVAYTDYPSHMPNLVPQVIEHLQKTTVAAEMCSLLRIISHVMAVFEYCMQGDRRLPLHRVIIEAFPLLLQLLQKMNQTDGLEASAVAKEVVRIFHRATSFRISDPLLENPEVGAQWLTEVIKVIARPLPAGQPEDVDQRAEWAPWKARKWAMHVLCCMCERCGDLEKIQKRINRAKKEGEAPQLALFQFAQMWYTKFRHTFIDLCYKLLMTSSQEWYHPRMVQTAMECLSLAAKRDADWEILKPHALTLLQKALFPCTWFSADDRDLWEEDSVDFMRQEFDEESSKYSTKKTAMFTLIRIIEDRDSCALPYFQFLFQTFSSVGDQKNAACIREGVMYNFGSLSAEARMTAGLNLIQLVTDVLFPMVTAHEPYLAARALWALGHYFDVKLSQEQLGTVLKTVLSQFENAAFPVRVSAALCLGGFIQRGEDCVEPLRPLLSALLEAYLKMLSEFESEALVSALEMLVYMFRKDIGPHAAALVKRLCEQIVHLFRECSQEDGTVVQASYATLRALRTVLGSVGRSEAVWPQINEILIPLLSQEFLKEDGLYVDYYDDFVKLVTYMTYYTPVFQPVFWELAQICINAFYSHTIDSMEDIVPIIDNLISREPSMFISNPALQKMVLDLALKGFASPEDQDTTDACKLVEIVMLVLPGQADQFVGPLLTGILAAMKPKGVSRGTREMLVTAQSAIMIYNVQGYLQLLASKNLIKSALAWNLKNLSALRNPYSKKMAVVGLSCLFDVPVTSFPANARPVLSAFVPSLIEIIRDLENTMQAKVEKQRKRLAGEEDSDEEEGEFDDFDDVDPNSMSQQDLDEILGVISRVEAGEHELLDSDDDDDDDDDDDNDNDEDSGYKDRDTAETHEDSDGQEDDDDTAEEASSSSDSVSDSDEDEDQRPPSPVDEPYPQDLHRSAEDPLPSQHKDGAKQAKKPSGELSQKQKRGKQKEQQREEARRKEKDRAKAAFFLEEDDEDLELVQEAGSQLTFTDLHLSRALVKACIELGWGAPTEVQARCVPAVLSGRDVCGSAQTGSGKTAAFLLPVLERLLHADRRVPATRVLVLTPTRELAAQIDGMLSKLRRYCPPSIDSLLAVGGLSLREQAVAFRRRPTIVVGTPGRVLDLVRNEMSVSLEDVEVLVLDEADRLLDMGFRDELNELLHCCPSRTRQTLLFSATMTEAVTRLASVCQSRPVRVSVNDKYKAPRALSQEFVRVRQRHEGDREALLLSLCARTFHQQVVVFFNNKRHTHRMRVIFGLAGLRAAELHGNLTQAQRLDALRQFGEGEADYLLATDLAGRGLDLPAVRTVINYNLPGTLKQYMHRIGRTARAGRAGRAVSLVGEADRPLLKLILRKGEVQAKGREVPADSVAHWRARIEQMQPDLRAIAHEEHIERELRLAEQEAARAENLLHHEAEIFARPRRTWFQSSEEKEVAKKHSLRTALGRELRGEEGTAAEAKRAEEALEAEKAEKAAEKAKRRRERKKQSHEDAEAAELEREERGIKLAVRAAKRKAREAADRHSALPTERQIKRDEARERERAQQSVFEEEMKSAQIGARKKTRNTMRREREIDAKLNTVKKPIKKKGRQSFKSKRRFKRRS